MNFLIKIGFLESGPFNNLYSSLAHGHSWFIPVPLLNFALSQWRLVIMLCSNQIFTVLWANDWRIDLVSVLVSHMSGTSALYLTISKSICVLVEESWRWGPVSNRASLPFACLKAGGCSTAPLGGWLVSQYCGYWLGWDSISFILSYNDLKDPLTLVPRSVGPSEPTPG